MKKGREKKRRENRKWGGELHQRWVQDAVDWGVESGFPEDMKA